VHQLLDFQRFANITQTLDFQCFYASLGAGRVGQGYGAKQGIRWLGLVLSKGVKFGVEFSKQGFGAWCCVGAVRVLSKQARVWFGVGAKQG